MFSQQSTTLEFDPAKRPKVGLGILILNEFDEVLCSQRLQEGGPFHLNWQFPGGYLEFGESFEEGAAREVAEECGVPVKASDIHYITTLNVKGEHVGYHNVGINLLLLVKKQEFKFTTTEPHKNTDWRWVKWEKFVELEPLFIPFKYFFQQGYKDLDVLKAQFRVLFENNFE